MINKDEALSVVKKLIEETIAKCVLTGRYKPCTLEDCDCEEGLECRWYKWLKKYGKEIS